MERYIIKYHHGGILLREGGVRYINGVEVKFNVDPDRICYWDLIGDMKEMGFDVEKLLKMFYVDGEDILKNICNDDDTIALVDQLRINRIVDIYVESYDIKWDKKLPDALMPPVEGVVKLAEGVVDLDCNEDNLEGGGEVEAMQDNIQSGVEVSAMQENEESDSSSGSDDDSCDDEEERLVDTQFECDGSDVDEERDQGRENVTKFIKMKKTIQDKNHGNDNRHIGGDEGRTVSVMAHSLSQPQLVLVIHCHQKGRTSPIEDSYKRRQIYQQGKEGEPLILKRTLVFSKVPIVVEL